MVSIYVFKISLWLSISTHTDSNGQSNARDTCYLYNQFAVDFQGVSDTCTKVIAYSNSKYTCTTVIDYYGSRYSCIRVIDNCNSRYTCTKVSDYYNSAYI